MSHLTCSDRARSRRLYLEPLEDRSLPSALSPLPPSVKHPDHAHGPPADVAAKVGGKHDGGDGGTHGNSAGHDGGSADHGRGDSGATDAKNAVGQEAAGLPDTAASAAVQAVAEVAHRVPADRQAVVGSVDNGATPPSQTTPQTVNAVASRAPDVAQAAPVDAPPGTDVPEATGDGNGGGNGVGIRLGAGTGVSIEVSIGGSSGDTSGRSGSASESTPFVDTPLPATAGGHSTSPAPVSSPNVHAVAPPSATDPEPTRLVTPVAPVSLTPAVPPAAPAEGLGRGGESPATPAGHSPDGAGPAPLAVAGRATPGSPALVSTSAQTSGGDSSRTDARPAPSLTVADVRAPAVTGTSGDGSAEAGEVPAPQSAAELLNAPRTDAAGFGRAVQNFLGQWGRVGGLLDPSTGPARWAWWLAGAGLIGALWVYRRRAARSARSLFDAEGSDRWDPTALC
jgi:hypothetical protein